MILVSLGNRGFLRLEYIIRGEVVWNEVREEIRGLIIVADSGVCSLGYEIWVGVVVGKDRNVFLRVLI